MWRDEGWLLDILIAARRIREWTDGMTRESFLSNQLVQDAVIRQCTIIGEAANRLTEAFLLSNPSIPWTELIAFRNRLVHEYFRIDLDLVWDVVDNHIITLIHQIEPLIPPPEDTPDDDNGIE